MTVRDTIIDMIRRHPLITKNKVDAYDHLFMTVGNGYEWVDGELVYWNKEQRFKIGIESAIHDRLFGTDKDIIMTSIFKSHLNDVRYDFLETPDSLEQDMIIDVKAGELTDRMISQKVRLMGQISKILHAEEEADKACWMHNESDLYDLSGYSKICNIPDDITDDWKEAIIEFYNFIMNDSHLKIIEYRKKYGERITEVLKDKNIIKILK